MMKKLSRRTFVNQLGLGLGASTFLPPTDSLSYANNKFSNNYQGKKLQVALCGLGRYANILKIGLIELEYCQLAGIITGTPSKGKKWSKDFSIPQKNIYNYESFDDLANNKDIDLVYVVLPNSMHKE